MGRDVDHCLCVWDWRKEERLASCKTGVNPVMAVRFDPITSAIITAGVRHLKFWTMVGTTFEVSLADLNKKGSLQTFLSIGFMKVRRDGRATCTTVTGCHDGSLYLWNEKGRLITVEKKAHEGPVTVIVVPRQGDQDCGTYALTGGADGKVRRWDAHMSTGVAAVWTIDLEEKTRNMQTPFSSRKFPVRGIAASNDRIYVGTCMNEMYQFALETTAKVPRAPECSMVVVQAHTQGSIYGMDVHPLRHEFVTVAWDSTLRIWDTLARKCLRAMQLMPYDDHRLTATAVHYSPDGEHLSVGFENGELWIFDASAIAAAAAMNWDCEKLFLKNENDEAMKLSTTGAKAVSILRYSPDGLHLLAACLGGKVSIFKVQDDDGLNSYEKVKTLAAHKCNIRSIDFSEDCSMMQSTGVDMQLLYWRMQTPEGDMNPQLIGDAASMADVVWASWTSALGWPVEGIYDPNRHDQHSRTSAFASRDKHLLLAWEDKDVLLYNFPCRGIAAARRLKGHASVPASVRLLHQDHGMVSVGSKDMCIIQWKPADTLHRVVKQDDTEVRALIARSSLVRQQGLLVRITLDERSDMAVSSSLAATAWKEISTGLSQLLKVGEERFQLFAIRAGSLVFDICLLPHEQGWNIEPTASTMLERLGKLFETGVINRKFPKLVGDLEVLLGSEDDDDDDFMGIKPWLGVVCAPSDWSQHKGSKLLNYAPTAHMKVVARQVAEGTLAQEATQLDQEAMQVWEAMRPCLVPHDSQLHDALDVDAQHQPAHTQMLTLQHVHGYQGWAGGNNLFFLDAQHLVYSAGAVGVVQHVPSNTQRFMAGHKDQIGAMAKQPCPHGATSCLFATGEFGQRGTICIWHVSSQSQDTPTQSAGLQGFHMCDVAALCFMGTDWVVSVGSDTEHHLAVWDVNSQKLVCSSHGDMNAILAVHSPVHGIFVSVGVSHIKFWRLDDKKPALLGRGGIFGNKGHVQTMLCVATFFQNEELVTLTGTEDGSIYVWKDRMLCFNLRNAHRGPVFSLSIPESASGTPDTPPELVLSGGKDGMICISAYDMSAAALTKLYQLDIARLQIRPALMSASVSVRALAHCSAGEGWLRVGVGTGGNEVVQVEIDVRNPRDIKVLHHTLQPVVRAHSGTGLTGLCAHAELAEFSTVGHDGVVRLWDATIHQLIASINVGHAASAIDYNVGANAHLAVALTEGGVVILDAAAMRRGRDYKESFVTHLTYRRCLVTDVKYSPDGQYLAVASTDNVLDIYLVKTNYNRWGVCRGHREVVRQIDWACDSVRLRSNDASEELLFWNITLMHKGGIEPIEAAHKLNDVAWSSANCPMTWASQGACHTYADVSEITAVDRSHNGALLATADHFGSVRLFRYPSLEQGLNQRFEAHAGPITNIKFTFDDSVLLSICSSDMCILEWKVKLVPTDVHRDVAQLLRSSQLEHVKAVAADGGEEENHDLQLFKPFHAGVFAPNMWQDGRQLSWQPHDSMYAVPNQELELEAVHGCRGHDRHGNACFNSSFHAVYYTAKLVVVQDREHGLQRFFMGHSEDISCVAPHPIGRLFASGQTGTTPLICVWDSQRQEPRSFEGRTQRSLKQIVCFQATDAKGILVMSFAEQGTLLVTVSDNLEHSLTVWDWQRRVVLSVVAGSMNATLAIASNDLQSPPGEPQCLVTCGVKHVRFWGLVAGKLIAKNADLSSKGVMSIQLSCTFSNGYAITGNQEGFLYMWKDARLVSTVKAHNAPVFVLHTATHLSDGNAVFCSGGGDGVIKLWTIPHKALLKIKPPALPQGETSENDMSVSNEILNVPQEQESVAAPGKVGANGGMELDLRELHCFAPQGIEMAKVLQDLNVPSVDQAVSVRGAFLQYEPGVQTISTDGIWRILVGTAMNEVYQLTVPQLISAPNDMTTERHDGLRERETIKVYVTVTYGDEGVGTRKLPAIQLLAQGHCPRLSVPTTMAQQQSDMVGDVGYSQMRALAAHPHDETEFATCAADGVLRIWDSQHSRVRFMYPLRETVQCLCYSPSAEDTYHLAVGCKAKILIYDASLPLVFGQDMEPLARLEKAAGLGARDLVTCLKYSSTCNSNKTCYMAAGLSSGGILLFSAPISDSPDTSYSKIARFKGHSGAILHLDFSKQPGGDAENLSSNCSRFELRFWDLKRNKERKTPSEVRDQLWESHTCSLSWAALGIGADDYQEVPSLDRSPENACLVGAIWPDDAPLLAVSGKAGQIIMARYPCIERSRTKCWTAHSTGVSLVRFTYGAQCVVSIGDVDMTVCQWRRQLPVHIDVERILLLPATMKAGVGEAEAIFMAKDHGSHDSAAGMHLGAQAAFDDAKPFLSTTRMLKASGWDGFHPDDLLSAGRMELSKYDLKLHHVHGSRGHCASNNVRYNNKGQALYVAAGVVVVQEGDSQLHHFQGHDDDVLCMDVSDDGKLVATGQVGHMGNACIWIWDAIYCEKEVKIDVRRHGGIYAVSFKAAQGHTPMFLASISNDEDSTIHLWDLRQGLPNVKLLTSIAADTKRVLTVAWNPFYSGDIFGSLVTCGDKHLNFWTLSQGTVSEEEDVGGVAREGAVHLVREAPLWYDSTKQSCLSICFIQTTLAETSDEPSPHGYTLTGMQDGSVFIWKWQELDAGQLVVQVLKVLPSLHEGPIFSLVQMGQFVFSGGNDGLFKMWQLESFGDGAGAFKQIDMASVCTSGTNISKVVTPSVRSVCARMDGSTQDMSVLVATASNEIYELGLTGAQQDKFRIVLQAHAGHLLQGLAMHKVKEWCATVGDDCVVRVWDLDSRACTHAAVLTDAHRQKVGGKAVCFRGKVDRPVGIQECPVCHYGNVDKEPTFDCDELAVGTLTGDVVIFKMGAEGQLLECARTNQGSKAISCLQYAPTGLLLAAASEDMLMRVLLPDEEHRTVGVCKGHLSPICSIDWTDDGEYMQTSDTALELIFWSMKTRIEKPHGALPEFVAYSKPMLLYKRQWASFTTPLGWPWHGIYMPGSEAVGLNAVDRFILDRGSKKALGVSADASGLVKLFPYPNQAGTPGMQVRKFEAHSAGVSKVRFSAGGKYVVSVGGRDCTLMQWQVLAPSKDAGAIDLDAGGAAKQGDDDSDESDDELDRLRAGK